MAKLGTTTFDQGANDTEVELTDHGSAPSPTAGKLYANTTSVYWEDDDLTGGGGETVTKKISKQLANTTGLLDMTESACTAVNLVITSNTTLDGPYFTKHTITGTSQFDGVLIHSDVANTSTTFTDSGIGAHTVTASGNINHRTNLGHPFKYAKTTANTSMYFDGTGDYLTITGGTGSDTFYFGTGSFSMDGWIYRASAGAGNIWMTPDFWESSGAPNQFCVRATSGGLIQVQMADNQSQQGEMVFPIGTATLFGQWNHLVVCRNGTMWQCFVNGVEYGATSISGDISTELGEIGGNFEIGNNDGGGNIAWNGYMDEIRIINGYCPYVTAFTPPTRPYSGHEFAFSVDTKAKYCGQGTYQTSSDVGAAVRMGNDSTGSGAAKVSIGDTFNVNSISYSIPLLFENSASGHNHIHYNIWTEVWGNTELEDADTTPVQFGAVHYGTRGVFALGASSPATPDYIDTIDYFTIGSASAASDFGNLTQARAYIGGVSNGSRGLFFGGSSGGPTNYNTIDYITIGSAGDAVDYGDMVQVRYSIAGCSNGYRGALINGYTTSSVNTQQIDYVNIATVANAIDFFGAPTVGGHNHAALSNDSRGVYTLSQTGVNVNSIEYITISSSAEGINFGDLVSAKYALTGYSDGSRGVFSGGFISAVTNEMDYLSVGTLGDAVDFGNLQSARQYVFGTSNGSRGLTAGGITSAPAHADVIDYVTIGVASDASDFDELSVITHGGAGVAGS